MVSSTRRSPLHDTILHAYRVSPLYHGGGAQPKELGRDSLTTTLATTEKEGRNGDEEGEGEESRGIRSILNEYTVRRFEEILRGDIVRGVHVGQSRSRYSNGGGYDNVDDADEDEDDDDDDMGSSSSGLAVLGKAGRLIGCRWTKYPPPPSSSPSPQSPPPPQEDVGERNEDDEERENYMVDGEGLEREDDDNDGGRRKGLDHRGILIEIIYEQGAFHAILLRRHLIHHHYHGIKRSEQDNHHTRANRARADENAEEINVDDDEDNEGFISLPLLLTNMPISLRNVFIEFITTVFDARISKMAFSSSMMAGLFEGVLNGVISGSFPGRTSTVPMPTMVKETSIHEAAAGDDEEEDLSRRLEMNDANNDDEEREGRRRRIQELIKDVQITLSFPEQITGSSLRSLDISISDKDLLVFLARGRDLDFDDDVFTTSTNVEDMVYDGSGRNIKGGKRKEKMKKRKMVFFAALSEYLQVHLGFANPFPHLFQSNRNPILFISKDHNSKEIEEGAAAEEEGERAERARKKFGSRKGRRDATAATAAVAGEEDEEEREREEGITVSKINCAAFSVDRLGRIRIHSRSHPHHPLTIDGRSESAGVSYDRDGNGDRHWDEMVIDHLINSLIFSATTTTTITSTTSIPTSRRRPSGKTLGS